MKNYLVKHRTLIGFGLLITFLALWLQVSEQKWSRTIINRLDQVAYDLRLNLTLPSQRATASKVVIVDIDEASLRAEGRWPWSRHKMGELVAALKRAGVRTIGFDVAFTEPERNVAQELIEAASASGPARARRIPGTADPGDGSGAMFARQLKDQNMVLGFLFHSTEDESVGALPTGLGLFPRADHENLTIPIMPSYTGNLPRCKRRRNTVVFSIPPPTPTGCSGPRR